jgi:phage terminase large subunit GpA-like protein
LDPSVGLGALRRVDQKRRRPMGTCEVCGNEYEMTFEVVAAAARHVFDSFECAIHKMAPICEHCGCRIVGHGVEAEGHFYCCASCARVAGARTIRA